MDSNNVKRSSNDGMMTDDSYSHGVGARHRDHPLSLGGGGYLDNCTTSEVGEKKSRDPRLDELSEMGIGGYWRSLAEEIGYDAFIVVWKSLSERADEGVDKHRVYIPRFECFKRFQRNRYILSLSNEGLIPKEIKAEISSTLNENISVNHIHRLIKPNTR